MAVSIKPSKAVDCGAAEMDTNDDGRRREYIDDADVVGGSDPNRSVGLQAFVDIFTNWLYMPDPAIVEVIAATYAANQFRGDAVWLMVVGGPSTGKTEPAMPYWVMPD